MKESEVQEIAKAYMRMATKEEIETLRKELAVEEDPIMRGFITQLIDLLERIGASQLH